MREGFPIPGLPIPTQNAYDLAVLHVVLAEEAAPVSAAKQSTQFGYKFERPEIPSEVLDMIEDIEDRNYSVVSPVYGEVHGIIDTLRAFGRIPVREAQADES